MKQEHVILIAFIIGVPLGLLLGPWGILVAFGVGVALSGLVKK